MCLHLQCWQVKGSLSNEAACLNLPKFSFKPEILLREELCKSTVHCKYLHFRHRGYVFASACLLVGWFEPIFHEKLDEGWVRIDHIHFCRCRQRDVSRNFTSFPLTLRGREFFNLFFKMYFNIVWILRKKEEKNRHIWVTCICM